METNFQSKCLLQHGSDLPTVARLQLAGCCSAVTLSFMFVEGSAFVLFLWFNFRFPTILLKLSLVDSSLDMGRYCPFFFFLNLRITIPKKTTLFLCAILMLKIQGCFATSAPPCVPLQSVVRISTYSFQFSPRPSGNHLEFRVMRISCFRTSLVDLFIDLVDLLIDSVDLFIDLWFIHADSSCLHLILAFHLSYSSLVTCKGEFARRQSINKWPFAFLVLEGRIVLFKFK